MAQLAQENLEQSADGADVAQLGEGVGDLLRQAPVHPRAATGHCHDAESVPAIDVPQVGKCADSQKYLEKSRNIREQQGLALSERNFSHSIQTYSNEFNKYVV